MPKPKKISKKQKQNIIIAVGWGIIFCVVIGYGSYRGATFNKRASVTQSNVSQVSEEGVTWLAEPQEIFIDTNLFTHDWEEVLPADDPANADVKIHYYKVGEDKGKNIIITILPGIDPSGIRHIMLLQDGDIYKILLQHSSDVVLNGGYNGPIHAGNVEEAYNPHYATLLPPEPLQLQLGTLKNTHARFAGRYFFGDYMKGTPEITEHIEKIQTTPWGDLYSHTQKQVMGDGTGATVNIQQFILKLADGGAVAYQSALQFIGDDNIPLITWNDGTKNTDPYAWNSLGGCGAPGYVAVADPTIMKDLVPAGKTVTDDTVYEFKNTQSDILKKYYEQLPNGTYYYYDSATGESKQISISIEEYAKNHGVFIYKDGFGRYIIFLNQRFGTGAECGKPVIYLYPTQTTQVSVAVGAKITKSEPDYANGWNVTAHPDGSIVNVDGKPYTSLFWEGTGHGAYPLVESGFVVSQEKLEATLQGHLAKLGLNTQESKEFMEFWLPHMPQTPYVRLTWFGTRQMNELAPLSITPKPDTTIRLFLDFEGLEKPITLPAQRLSAPVRTGFTVVEWGGLLRHAK